MAQQQINLALLATPDNAVRKQAEAQLDQLQATNPALLANQLVDTLADPAADGMVRTLSAVLIRRRLPGMFAMTTENAMPMITDEWKNAIKAKLLVALQSGCDASLRRKICDAVGRLGVEMHAEGKWPELMSFVQQACSAGEPTAHEAALSVISHMAPALIDPAGWANISGGLQAMLVAALADGVSPAVQHASLSALSELLAACAAQEKDADTAAERKKFKAVATDLQPALPAMLRTLEVAVGAGQPERISEVLSYLSAVAAAQPRLFKPVLPMVVEGMAQLGAGSLLDGDARIACAELLLTLAEGAPKLCSKLDVYVPRVLAVLLPMLLRLGGDLSDWESAMPEDGLREDDEDEEEKEANYASEAIERLCESLGGDEVTKLMLPELQGMLQPTAPWASRHAALVAIATVCEHGSAVIEPHLASLVGLLQGAATAGEARLRWATCYCAALMCDEYDALPEKHHATLAPLLIGLMADPSPRVRAAACLATVNFNQSLEETSLLGYAQQTLSALHAILSCEASPDYVVYAACSSLAILSSQLSEAAGKPMGSAYAAFAPHLAQRLGGAVAKRYGRLAGEILAALGNLSDAAGAQTVAADAPQLIASVASLVARKEVSEDRTLLRATHTCLTKLAGVARGAFGSAFEQLLPSLLQGVATEVEFHMDKVEEQPDENADDNEGWEVQYFQNKGKGFMRLRINASQMDEKLLCLEALYSYAVAMGASFLPAVRPLVEACLPVLTYRWSDKARGAAAMALSEAYKCTVLAATDESAAATGATKAHALELSGVLLKPLTEQLNKEDSLEAIDSFLEAFKQVLTLERTHKVGALEGAAALNGTVQLIKTQLQKDEKRLKARAAEEAERDEDEEGSEEEEAEKEQEAEVLLTCIHLMAELLKLHGASAVTAIEAQLLSHVQPWLLGDEPTRLSLGLETLSLVIEHAGKDAGKKYVTAALPLLAAHLESEEPKLRRAALYGLGVIAEHGGKLLTRAAAADVAGKLLACLSAPDARYSANLDNSEVAAAALGKVLVHRAQAVDPSAALPVWLSFLPLRTDEDEARSAITSLCKLLEAEAPAVLGADGARFPAVLGAMAAAYEAEATGDEVSSRLKALVQSWNASNQAQLQQAAGAMPEAHLREKLGRMAAA